MSLPSPSDRPPYVRFERRAVEDRAASEQRGHYMTKDADFVLITPAGSKDEVEKPAGEWLQQLKEQVKQGRVPMTWETHFTAAYEHWKRGEELPVNGTPIKGWPLLSAAVQSNIIAANIRTVEDLAVCNGEALQRIGMGAVDLKQKAEAWLKASTDIGKVVQENVALRVQLADAKDAIKRLEARNEALVQAQPKVPA